MTRIAALLACLLLCLAGPAAAEPALWRVSDADTEMYLFGTVHVLHPDADWLAPETGAALAAADTLVLETQLDAAGQDRAALLAERHSYLPAGQRLSGRLSAADYALFVRAAEAVGLDAGGMGSLRPWMASLVLSLRFAQNQGQDAEAGADRILMDRARSAGAALEYLEAPEDQIAVFAGLSPEGEADMLVSTAREILETPDILARLDGAWLDGDVQALSDIAAESMKRDAPELYAAALLDRNTAWTERLAAMLADDPGVIFVAVGAAHLAGPDSVVDMLARRGFDAERIN